jgi:hypothetical protein
LLVVLILFSPDGFGTLCHGSPRPHSRI